MTATIQDMAEHVNALVRQHEIHVNYDSDECGLPEGGFAAIELWEIWIPTINFYKDYCTALHEIGHILGDQRWSNDRMTREKDAWTWAKENALSWTQDAQNDANDCLSYYEKEIAAGRISATCE